MKTMIRTTTVLAACFFLVLTSQASYAQRGGGGRGMGGTNRVQLCSLKEVQAELKLTDEQKKTAVEINEKYSAGRQEIMQGAAGDFAAAMEKTTKLSNELTANLTEKLNDTQKARLTQIFVQVNGTGALSDPDVQKALKVTDEQSKKLTEARNGIRDSMRSAFGDLQNASQEERRAKMTEFQKTADGKLFACISAEQKTEFEAMSGTKLDIDTSSLAPRRPNN